MKYENPPINELVIGVYFKDPIPRFRVEHVGLYWSRIIDDFPNSTQNMSSGCDVNPFEGEVFPMPRFWFKSEDDVYLIQVQRNAFLFNWRRREEDYPHYEALKKKFDKHFSIFESFCRDQFDLSQIEIEKCELNYINTISDEEYFSSFSDTKSVIPSFEPLSIHCSDKKLKNFNVSYIYSDDDNMTLVVVLQSRRHRKTEKDALYFELRSRGELSSPTKKEADLWFDNAHDVVGKAFANLTSDDIQRHYWERKEG